MGLYKYRVRVPMGEWTNWNDWSSTPASVMMEKSKSGSSRGTGTGALPASQMPINMTSRIDFDYSQPIKPPPRPMPAGTITLDGQPISYTGVMNEPFPGQIQ